MPTKGHSLIIGRFQIPVTTYLQIIYHVRVHRIKNSNLDLKVHNLYPLNVVIKKNLLKIIYSVVNYKTI